MDETSIERFVDNLCAEYEAAYRAEPETLFNDFIQRVSLEHQEYVFRRLIALKVSLLAASDNSKQRSLDFDNLKLQFPSFVSVLDEFETSIRSKSEWNEGSSDWETSLPTSGKQMPAGEVSNQLIPTSGSAPTLANYQLLNVIGEGGMGTVWLAEQLRPVKRRVAIKIIKQGIASKEVIVRFEAERQALAMMDHPGISRVLDAGTNDSGQPYFAMEFVDGLSLTSYCDKNRLNLRDRLRLFTQVCDAVQHAHQKGILHRDLKPSNILVTEYNGMPQPKVIDFGLAKALETSQRLTEHSLFTEFGQILGTLKYMSPEQAGLNACDVDTRADIYALGVVLYELLTGTTPMDTDTLKNQAFLRVLELVREQESPRPSQRLSTTQKDLLSSITSKRQTDTRDLLNELSGDLDWIVMKSLDKERSRRYGTANDFARDVMRYLSNEPIEARPPSTAYRLKKLYLRNRLVVTSGIATTVALVAGMLGTIWFAVDATVARGQAIKRQAELELALTREREISLDLVQLSEQLADNYLNAGDRVQALPLFKKALEKSEQILGPESPSALGQMHSIAFLLGLDNRIEEAIPIQEKVMDATTRVLGLEAPETHSAISNLAASYLQVGQVSEATRLFEKVYKLRSSQLEQDDFSLRVSMRWMVISYSILERWEDALPVASKWLEHLQRVNEGDSPEAAWALASLAAIQCGLQNYNQAEEFATQLGGHGGVTPADQHRGNNVLACCQAYSEIAGAGLTEETTVKMGQSYAELKKLLEELPGFKQFFVTNACKRNLAVFVAAGNELQARIWRVELDEIEASIRENRKPLHPGIPTFDPITNTEEDRFSAPKNQGKAAVKTNDAADDR